MRGAPRAQAGPAETAVASRLCAARRAPTHGGPSLADAIAMRPLIALVLVASACDGFATQECISDPMDEVIDPATGACIVLSNRDGCQYCFDSCVVADRDELDYADCRGACTAATEAACLAQPGCRATYTPTGFAKCVATAPSGALHDGRCSGLDAYQCSRHDNCSAWYGDTATGSGAGAAQLDHSSPEPPPPA
jgi:hypothetical protein